MKVLFAVSSESISEAIIKRYQKEYKEILSYKNVYYFNAILKEIQKDKTYDRIVISEDLEPFSNSNYDTIDKFIFEKLDSISDEAHDNSGKEASIILICTDRRVKGSSILVKLFGIGVYNALLGNDRSMDEVCKLINRPRSKKDAKIYYRIDAEDVNYKAENENEVSEVEIQNILAHFKKLGRNTAKYTESFNNISAQYTDEQLRIIVNCLPINVKAVLESECERYQELMAVTGKIPSVKGVSSSASIEGVAKNEVRSKSIGPAGNVGGRPIVIPSAVRNARGGAARRAAPTTPRVAQPKVVQKQAEPEEEPEELDLADLEELGEIIDTPVQKTAPKTVVQPTAQAQRPVQSATQSQAQRSVGPTAVQRPTVAAKPAQPVSQVQQKPVTPAPVTKEPVSQENNLDDLDLGLSDDLEDDILPGFEDENVEELDDLSLPGFGDEADTENIELPGLDDELGGEVEDLLDEADDLLPTGDNVDPLGNNEIGIPGFDDLGVDVDDNIDNGLDIELDNELDNQLDNELDTQLDSEPRRGRGRPRKTPVSGATTMDNMPRRGRGRPRKIVEEAEDLEEVTLPGLEDLDIANEEDELPGLEGEDTLPGFEDSVVEDDGGDILPGFEDNSIEAEPEDEIGLPGLDDLDVANEEDELPGLEGEDTLPGFEDSAVEDDGGDILPGFEDNTIEEEPVDELELGDDLLTGEDILEDDLEGELGSEEVQDVATDDINLDNLGTEDISEGEDLLDDLGDFDDLGQEEIAQDELVDENGMPLVEDELELGDDLLADGDALDDLEGELGEGDYTEEVALPGIDDLDDDLSDLEGLDDLEDDLGGLDESIDDGMGVDLADDMNATMAEGDSLLSDLGDDEETLLPGMGFEDEGDTMIPQRPTSRPTRPMGNDSSLESIRPKVDYSMSSLNSLITKDKKIITFIGTSKNGTSFLVNNLASLFSSCGINTAILDMTKNKNSYFIFTKNEEELRTVAYNSIEKLQNGYAEGVRADKNLTVYTDVPNSGRDYSNAEPILSTLVQNHSLILIDCDYDTDFSYFASCQEMYLVQSMDILTIQPLTAFLRELKTRGVLEPEKIRVVINKELKIHKRVGDKDIIGGLAYYNDPAMSFMTELFNKDTVKAISIPFDVNAYARYLGGIVDCEVSVNGYSKQFLTKLKLLGDMVYPLTSKQSYSNKPETTYNPNAFSNSMNDTLSKMRKKY